MRNIKEMWLAGLASGLLSLGACVAPDAGEGSTQQAVTGDHSLVDQIAHYGFAGQTGQSRVLAYLGANVTDFASMESDLNAMLPAGTAACTRANACLKVVSETGSTTTGFPTSEVKADRYDAALAIAAIHAASPNATIVLIDAAGKNGTHLINAIKVPQNVPTLAIKAFEVGFGIAPTDPAQSTISTWLTAHPLPVTAPAGALTWSGMVRVGFSTYTGSGADTTWTGFSGANDVMALGDAIPQVQDGSSVTAPSFTAGPGLILAELDEESGSVADRSTLLAASGTHFAAVSGSSSTLGAFVAGGQL